MQIPYLSPQPQEWWKLCQKSQYIREWDEKQEKYFLFYLFQFQFLKFFYLKKKTNPYNPCGNINTFLCQDCFLNYRIIIEIEFDLPSNILWTSTLKKRNFFFMKGAPNNLLILLFTSSLPLHWNFLLFFCMLKKNLWRKISEKKKFIEANFSSSF